MNTSTKIVAVTPVALGVVGLSQFHYVISHLGQISTAAAAVGVGVALWTGKSLKARFAKPAAQPEPAASVDERIAELAAELQRRQALPRPTQVIDYTSSSQSVTRQS